MSTSAQSNKQKNKVTIFRINLIKYSGECFLERKQKIEIRSFTFLQGPTCGIAEGGTSIYEKARNCKISFTKNILEVTLKKDKRNSELI